MYDPEEAMKMELLISENVERLEELRERRGDDHPVTQYFEVMIDLLRAANEVREDYANCFDPDEKEELEKRGFEIVKVMNDSLDRIVKIQKTLLENSNG